MCGVHAMMRMPSAAAMRAISSDVASSGEPSSMPGSMWQWRSIIGDYRVCRGIPSARSLHATMEHHARQRREPHRIRRHVQREVEHAVQDHRQQPDPAPICSSVKLRPRSARSSSLIRCTYATSSSPTITGAASPISMNTCR